MTGARATLQIAANHPSLSGHFPGHPIVPGVVLLDEVLHLIDLRDADRPSRWHIGSIKFHRAVLPGQSLCLEYALDGGEQIRFELRLAEAMVANGTLERLASASAVTGDP
jgi:3-hydroxyacyl-[acyl-carrier-protein] dehydratase